jgi:hypothetical protein
MSAALKAGALYFIIVFALGFGLGTLRVLVIIPVVGELAAVIIELPVMLVASWLACGGVLAKVPVPAALAPRLVMGVVAFVLLMAAEVAVSVFGFGRSVVAHLATYQALPAQLGLAAQAAFAAFPAARIRRA